MITRKRAAMVALSAVGLAAVAAAPDRENTATVFLGAIAVLSWMFVLTYGIRSRWRSTAAGRGVMQLMACIAVLCTQGMATILTDYSYPGREIIRPVLLLGIALAVLDLLLTLLRFQRTEPARPPESSP